MLRGVNCDRQRRDAGSTCGTFLRVQVVPCELNWRAGSRTLGSAKVEHLRCSPNVATVRLVIICNVYVSRDRRLLPRCRLGLRSSTTLTQRRLIVGYRRFGTACRFHRRRSSSLWRWERQADPTSVMKYQPATLNTPLERMAHLRIVSLPCDDYTSFCRVPCFELWYDVTLGILCMV